MNTTPTVNTYPHSNYSFSDKEPKFEKVESKDDRLARMKSNYAKDGMRRTVEGILLVHEFNHPHVLLFGNEPKLSKLPGGKLYKDEDEIEGLKRKLSGKLAPPQPRIQPDWQIGECVGVWWRPNFDSPVYPYCPPHIAKPKECHKLYIVHLSEKKYFGVRKNCRIFAVPLCMLHDNTQGYGTVLSSIPRLLSRFQFLPSISPGRT